MSYKKESTYISIRTIHNVPPALRQMRLSKMADKLEEFLNDPNSNLLTFEERMEAIVAAEYYDRKDKKIARLMKQANLKMPGAALSNLKMDVGRDLDMNVLNKLSTCEWIQQNMNLIITGPCGAGKTYISNA